MQLNCFLLGCDTSAGNLGVAALGHSLVRWIKECNPQAEFCIQTPGGLEPRRIELSRGEVALRSVPLHYSDSLRARYGTRRINAIRKYGRLAPRYVQAWLHSRNPGIDAILKADVVIDVSAGDSFAEIYGTQRFNKQCEIMELVLAYNKPLILAPQTFGPFSTATGRERVRRILEQCVLVATRDKNGLDELEELMGRPLDERFVACADMAFGLQPAGATESITSLFRSGRKTIGINVSELLYYGDNSFGVTSKHAVLINRILRMFLAETDCNIVLVPHVLPHRLSGKLRGGLYARSDVEACEDSLKMLGACGSGRVAVLRDCTTAPLVKKAISCCDFFVGARMHACIAAVSQGVPTASLAYSKKVAGVMGEFGVPEVTVDLRALDLEQAIEAVRCVYSNRFRLRELLAEKVITVNADLKAFFQSTMPAAIDRHRSTAGW